MPKKTVFYKKVGRKYEPVYEYDQELMDSFPKGSHIVICYPGGSSRRYQIDPAYGPMIAAGRVAEDAISDVIVKATELRRNYKMAKEMTPGQKAAWENLIKEFGEDARSLEWPSAREACEAAVQAMAVEAEKLLENPSVRKAYERFLLVAELTKEHKHEPTE